MAWKPFFQRPTFVELLAIGATITFGLISLTGIASILSVPIISAELALTVAGSVAISSVGIGSFLHFRRLRPYRYRIIEETQTITFRPDNRNRGEEKLNPIGYVHRTRAFKSLHNQQNQVVVTQNFTDRDHKTPDELYLDCEYQCTIESKKFGTVQTGPKFMISELRPFDIEIELPSPLNKGDAFVLTEELRLPNSFDNETEWYTLRVLVPTKKRNLKFIFEDIKINNAFYTIKHGHGEGPPHTCKIQQDTARPIPTYYFEIDWRRPKVGQLLNVQWQWDLNAAEITR